MTRAGTTTTHRADADIFTEARHALDQRLSISATVRLHVDKGIVTLTGNVRLPGERMKAQEVVRGVKGVQRIVNNITVAEVVSSEGFEAPDQVR